MSGSLSGFQMSPAAWSNSGTHHVGYDTGDENITTGTMYQPWTSGETDPSIRAGNLTTAGKHLSYAKQKGTIPLSHSKQTMGSYLFTADEGLHIPTAGGSHEEEK